MPTLPATGIRGDTITDDRVVVTVTPVKGVLRSDIVQAIMLSQTLSLAGYVIDHSDKVQALLLQVIAPPYTPAVPFIMYGLGGLAAWYAAKMRGLKADTVGQPYFKPPDYKAATSVLMAMRDRSPTDAVIERV